MMPEQPDTYLELNRRNWNQKASINYLSSYYDVQGFKQGKLALQPIERDGLGDVQGQDLLHLQCHFGLETLSLARLGARVVGVDFSDKAVDYAQKLAAELDIPGQFICSDIYDLPQSLSEAFDIVFVSYGSLGWLPDLDRWAGIVHRALRPGGMLYLVDFHPILWMMEWGSQLVHAYAGDGRPIAIGPQGAYADPSVRVDGVDYWWNHGLGQIFSALLQHGLSIDEFAEHPYCTYNAANMLTQGTDGRWSIEGVDRRYPILFTLRAAKTSSNDDL